jgi:alpha-L-rhamnosidase
MVFACLPGLTSCKNNENTFQAQNLKCEYLENTLGIDCEFPRFSWMLQTTDKHIKQSAYQIKVSTDSIALTTGKANVWDSFKIESDIMLVPYGGKSLKSFTKYYWTVICWDDKGQVTIPSLIASFETAMLAKSDWKGKWISDGKSTGYKPAPYFRKEFTMNKKVKSARVYTTAAGLFELSINGQKVGNELFNPMFTRFDCRNLYVTNDVTPFIKQGHNAIGILLGNGWYNHQSVAVWNFDKAKWRNRPRFLLNLRIEYEDGTSETIVSDESWKTADSPIIFNSIYTAEHYDARKELPGWDKPCYDDASWKPVVEKSAPSGKIIAQQVLPVRVTDTLTVVKMIKQSDKHYIFQFERNIAGTIKIKASGKTGTLLRICHAELLDDNNRPNLANIDYHYRPVDTSDPFQTDIFILSGTKEDIFSPRFNYKGFQYVEVISSEPVELTEQSLVALEIHSDVTPIGYIQSSNSILNKIWEASNSSYLANLFGYPTDCPQREKNGWTGDAHIVIETALYNFDVITVYEKWLNDFTDVQKENGVLPCIIPTSLWGYDWANGVDWTCAIAIIPWEIYLFYGDSRLLQTMYIPIKRYVDYITSISQDYLTDWGLGDWIPVKTKSNKELTTSLYYYACALILSKAATLFGNEIDAGYYTSLSEKIKTAINTKFLDKETGIYCSGSQTELAAPLFWKIVPENLTATVAFNLYKKVEENDFHLDVGLLGSKALLNALSENGYAGAACKIVAQETYPSWGWWIKNGATTFFENWSMDATTDASRNHIMFGEVNAWLYKGLGGIFPDEKQPGFKHIILKPYFAEELEHFEAKHQSPYGWIVSKWENKGKQVRYSLLIPPNSTATLSLPDNIQGDKVINLKSGNHSFLFNKK